jgi:hypothetical protein
LKRFRYALDPLCLTALVLYALNRWVFDYPALQGWFADVLLIPAAAPLFLWVERRLGLRQHDENPTLREVIFLFVVWTVAAEILAPILFTHCTADPLDALAYAAGAVVSMTWWRWPSSG